MVLSGPSTSEARSCHPKAEEANIIYMTWMNPSDLISLAFKRLPRTRTSHLQRGKAGSSSRKLFFPACWPSTIMWIFYPTLLSNHPSSFKRHSKYRHVKHASWIPTNLMFALLAKMSFKCAHCGRILMERIDYVH